MLFNSWPYVFLILGLMPLYYLSGRMRIQISLLILGSLFFYAHGQPYLLCLLLLSASLNAITSYGIVRLSRDRRSELTWAITGVVANLLVLGFFKYAGFFAHSIDQILSLGVQPGYWLLHIPLPIGISFYTFQGISLLMDLLRHDKGIRERDFQLNGESLFVGHFFKTIFFICFFPQLVAGPIVKAHQFYPQIVSKSFSKVNWVGAFKCLILGYFLKMGIADNLSAQTSWIAYPYFLNFSSLDLIVLLFGYSFQIFADFAGYSLIAIGTARLFGYELPCNFNFPYIAKSASEFWRRWHISLSSWLREYLYIPLGGNKKGAKRTYFNLFTVMFLGGLWHGAEWSYAVWGMWHGLALAFERFFFRRPQHEETKYSFFGKTIRIVGIFLFVTLSWLFFQLPNFSEAVMYLKSIFSNSQIGINYIRILTVAAYGVPVILYHLHGLGREHGYRLPAVIQNAGYGVMLWWILFNSGSSSAFIYFQF